MGTRRAFYAIKAGVLLLGFAGAWVGFAFLGGRWAQIAVAVVMAVVFTQVMFLGHDAAHRQIFRSNKVSEWTALVLGTGLGGVSLAWWNAKHTKHHQAPNQIDRDPDIRSAVLRFYPSAQPRNRLADLVYRRQGWWFFPLLTMEALHLHVQSMHTVITRTDAKRRWVEAALLAIRLGVYPAVLFAFLPWPIAAVFLGVQLAVTGLYLGSAFAVSHIGMPIVPKDSKIDFLRRQVLMSRNVAGGWAASLAMGGLNYQIEHHLFPAMARPNLRKARPIVQAFCTQRAIEYQEVPIHRAWAAVVRHLNQVGIPGALAAACPTAAALR